MTRARKNRIIVNSNTVAGKPVNTGTRASNKVLSYDAEQDEYTHVPFPEGINSFEELTDKPETLYGYGITDAYNKTAIGDTETDFVSLFEAELE